MVAVLSHKYPINVPFYGTRKILLNSLIKPKLQIGMTLHGIGPKVQPPLPKNSQDLLNASPFFYLVFEKLRKPDASVFSQSFPIAFCGSDPCFDENVRKKRTQNVSKIYGLEKKNQVCHETDELPLLYPAISIRAIASVPWTIRSAMYRTFVDAMLPWQIWVASPEMQEHRQRYLHCRYRQGSTIESGSEIPNGSATVW